MYNSVVKIPLLFEINRKNTSQLLRKKFDSIKN